MGHISKNNENCFINIGIGVMISHVKKSGGIKMLEAIRKEAIIAYVSEVFSQQEVEDGKLIETIGDDPQADIWLVEMDTGEEYWVVDDQQSLSLFHKSGILQNAQRAYDTYVETLAQNEQNEEIPNRSLYL